MEDLKLPYRAEYAKSGRAGCKGCKNPIAKDSLRLAVMIQSPFFDGMQPNWYHYSCFFKKFRPKSVSDVAHFESLRWDDQENIRKSIEEKASGLPASESTSQKTKNSKSKKRNNEEAVGVADIGDYTMEYAKSKRAKCKFCEETIDKDEIRISKKDYESEVAMKYGPTERWHHVDCFIKARKELKFFKSGKILPGFKSLSDEDQKMIEEKIPEIAQNDNVDGPSPPKKPKQSENEKSDPLKKKMKKQNDIMFKYHDELQLMKKSELQTLLEYNNQEIPEGTSRMVDRLSDAMAFGALKKCKDCKGQLVFTSGKGYICRGYTSEWSKCEAIYKNPSRVPFKVPEELKESYSFLDNFKGKVTERLFNETPKTENNAASKSEGKLPILTSFKIYIHKTEGNNSDAIKEQILSLGGSVVKKYEDDVLAVISTSSELQKAKPSKIFKSAQDSGIPVLPENFFEDIKPFSSPKDLIAKIGEKKISSWDSDMTKKIPEEKQAAVKKSVYPEKASSSSNRFKSNETVKKVTLKDGLAVDPDSNLEKVAHVYRKGKDIYSTVLSLTDIQSGKNSYYRMQILESDKKHKYWLFKAWGRIGTTIGGNKCDRYETLEDCIELFKQTFEEQTGNQWEKRKKFKKIPGKKIMLDVEYNENKEIDIKPKPKLESKILSNPVQNLIKLIFDVEEMKKTMLEFELDLNKMPLGKISRKQIQKAFQILTDLQNLADSKGKESDVIAKTNMFYSLVPHDFGINLPPPLNDVDSIKQKIDMLNSLLDIEIAFKMWQECENSENSIDEHYKQLNAEITDLDPNSDEYKTIELYVKNTHAKTHMNYSLEIEQVFKIKRKGEDSRYKKFNKLQNRKLLWHGSRITNFVGILSQGLRIAPPEAPVTGYMFGKGIYFADMVSKSANYCSTSKKNPTGLLLLCEVALGEMLELTQAEYIEKLPAGKHSVKGVGKTHPDPSEIVVSPTGVEVPVGKGIDSDVKESALLYNEYIVYDVNQVKIQYLLRLKFNYKI